MKINKNLLTIISALILTNCSSNNYATNQLSSKNLVKNDSEINEEIILSKKELEAFEKELVTKGDRWPFEH